MALFSGGLDSILAIKLIQRQGIEVIGLNFKSPFFGIPQEKALYYQKILGIKIKTIDVSRLYIKEVLLKPKYGYGKNANPCIDCHGFMVRYAISLLPKYKASFVITGEVLNERPFSQNKKALRLVEELGTGDELLLRPLSAKLLPLTKPEKEGLVKRDELLDISGRSRKRQIQLAKEFGIEDYPSPAGGCFLTDPGLSRRYMRLIKLGIEVPFHYELAHIGRHIWVTPTQKIVIPRNQTEDIQIQKFLQHNTTYFKAVSHTGPRAPAFIFRRGEHYQDEKLAQIYVRYLSKRHKPPFIINKYRGNSVTKSIFIPERINKHEELILWQE